MKYYSSGIVRCLEPSAGKAEVMSASFRFEFQLKMVLTSGQLQLELKTSP